MNSSVTLLWDQESPTFPGANLVKLAIEGLRALFPAEAKPVPVQRPAQIIGEHNGRFCVVFGRTEAQPGRCEPVGHQSALGKRWGLKNTTHFTATIELLPADFECKGFFVTTSGGSDQDDVHEYDTWIKLRALGTPVRKA
jgi:hypothetical protein